MPTILTGGKAPEAWHSRYEASRGAHASSRSSLAAAIAVAVVVAELLLAQLTLAFTICFLGIGWLTRWRPLWLACPAAAGLTWILAIGVRPAVGGYLALAGHVLRAVAGNGPAVTPGQLGLAGLWQSGLAGAGHLLPRQLPLALVAAAGQALVLRPCASRPGLLVAVRRAYVTATLRRGEVAVIDGGCVGVIPGSGRRLTVSWERARSGVLCTGRDLAEVTATGCDLAWAAIQHRKSVIIIDLSGEPGVAAAITAACAAQGAPLRWLRGLERQRDDHSLQPSGYDPLTGQQPDHAARLVTAMIDWSPIAEARRPVCANYLTTALALIGSAQAESARPAVPPRPAGWSRSARLPHPAGQPGPAGHPRSAGLFGPAGQPGPAVQLRSAALSRPLLAELAGLLAPGALVAGLRRSGLPPGHPIARHAAELASQSDADPRPIALIATQLAQFARSPLGQCLGQPGPAISIRQALTDRETGLFSLDRRSHGGHAAMLARLVVADLVGALTERAEAGAAADCLIWVNGCEAAGPRQLGELVAVGSRAGTCVLLGTASGGCASTLAAEAGLLILRGQPPAELAACLDDEPVAAADPAAVAVGVADTGTRPGASMRRGVGSGRVGSRLGVGLRPDTGGRPGVGLPPDAGGRPGAEAPPPVGARWRFETGRAVR